MLFLFLLFASSFQQAEPAQDQWEQVIESESGAVVSIDPSTVETRKGITYAWEHWDFSNDLTESDGKSIRLMGNKCDDFKRGSFVDRTWDKQGTFLAEIKFKKPDWQNVRSRSVGDALMIAACKADAQRRRELI